MAAGPLPLVQKVKGGLQCVVYVEIRNGGLLPSTGTETVELLWGKASAGLGWPDPWRGGIFDAAPYSASSMGGLIASIAIPPIPAGSSVVLTSPAPRRNGLDRA